MSSHSRAWLADVGDTDEARRRLHSLKTVCSASWYRPDGQIVAAVGDDWIGMAAIGYFAATNSVYNMFTRVESA
jgi:hypothetical protein